MTCSVEIDLIANGIADQLNRATAARARCWGSGQVAFDDFQI